MIIITVFSIVESNPVVKTTVKTSGDTNLNKTSEEIIYSLNSSFVNPAAAIKHMSIAILKNCSIEAKDSEIPGYIKELLNGGAELIRYNLNFDDNTTILTDRSDSLVFKPLYWVRATSRQGTGLLLLRNEFDILSLQSLSIGVSDVDVTLKETPRNCIGRLELEDAVALLRETVINSFQNGSSDEELEMLPNEHVCNMHVKDVDGTAEFRFYCCQRAANGKTTCKYLYEDTWLLVLFYVIGFLKIVVVLYSPRFVPGSYYREKFVAAPYVHKLKDDSKSEYNLVLTKYPERFRNTLNTFRLSKFRHMKEFKTKIQTLRHDVVYKLTFEDIHLRIKAARLLPEDYAPVWLLQSLYETFVKCNIRKREALTQCCSANVFSTSPCYKTFTWFKLMKEIMKVVMLIALTTPWLIRIAVYYQYEHDEMDMRKRAADEKDLRFFFPGNFTLLLTPLHISFIFIYILLSMESCIYGVLRKKVKEKFKFVLRKCFRDMRERKRSGIIGWAVKLALKPCTVFGGFGFCLGIVAWVIGLPFLAVILAFYMIPTLNITFRLVAHFAVYLMPRNTCNNACCKRITDFLEGLEKGLHMEAISSEETLEKNEIALKSARGRFQQLLVIILCLISLYSIIFLLTEVVSFGVEILIHTLMGIILNASVTLTYVSLALLIGMYANDCFGTVTRTFLAYNKSLNGMILGLGKSECENIMYGMPDCQKNLAFRVSMEKSNVVENPVQLMKDPCGYPRWRISRLLLFLSKKDIPQIPKSFYFAACKMPFYAVPDELLLSYIRAAIEFGSIMVFLLFVLVVVLAFGDTYNISTSNQLLATVAGGFVPFMLRKVVFKPHATPTVDTDNLNFQVCITDLLENYKQSWPIHDIIVETPKRLERQQSVYFDCVPDTDELDTDRDNHTTGAHTGIVDESSPLTAQPWINTPAQSVDTPIDILIDVNEIDPDEFPDMREPSDTDHVDF